MASRLDRLFVLLENGGSGITRKAAAYQLGEIVKLHPYKLETLLNRLHSFIISKSWETRIAAAQAVESIIKNMPEWTPNAVKSEEIYENMKEQPCEKGHLTLGSFNICRVLQKGSYLLGADENQFELEEEDERLDPKERIVRQRLLVNQRLGFDIAAAMGMDTDHIISNVDLATQLPQAHAAPKESVVQIINSELESAGLSSREMNRAKRKAKLVSRKSTESPIELLEDPSIPKKMKLDCSFSDEENDSLTIAEDKNTQQIQQWPLENFCERLCRDLFSCNWETRHGAATSLREVVKLQGEHAGKHSNQSLEQMKSSHSIWLEDKAVRLVCVLALDRFGDFLSDQVVAPVRETCAQVLGGVVHHLDEETVLTIVSLLMEMISWPDWGTRHGGLLGLKYILAVKQREFRLKLLSRSFSVIYKGLKDETDDVVSVAATCLVPVAGDLFKCLDEKLIEQLVATLWDALLDIDDLTASTSSILLLLAKLLECLRVKQSSLPNLESLVVRIWPFLYHNNSLIRLSALKTIETLTTGMSPKLTNGNTNLTIPNGTVIISPTQNGSNPKVYSSTEESIWVEKVLEPLLVHTFQRALLETNDKALESIVNIWNSVLNSVSISCLLMTSCKLISSWLCLLMTGHKIPLDSNNLVIAQHHPNSKVEDATRPKSDIKYYIGNTGSSFDTSDSVAMDKVARARCISAKLLGNLSHYISQPMPGIEYKEDQTPILCFIRLLLSPLTSRSGIQRFCTGLIVREWAIKHPSTSCHSMLKNALIKCVTEVIYYDEITWSFTRLQQESKDFVAMLKHYKVNVDECYCDPSKVLSLDQIKNLCNVVEFEISRLRKKVSETLEGRRKDILKSVNQTSTDQIKLNTTIQSVLAGALVRFKALPEKLNPVVKPLMESLKREGNVTFQTMAACDLTFLMNQCLLRDPCPNGKILKNLSTFLCIDEEFTPNILNGKCMKSITEGIISLTHQQKSNTQPKLLQRSISLPAVRGPGRPPLKGPNTPTPRESSAPPSLLVVDQAQELERRRGNEIQRRGCTIALTAIAKYFGENTSSKLPPLISMIFDPMKEPSRFVDSNTDVAQNVINWLQFLEVIIPSLHSSVLQMFDEYLPILDGGLNSQYNGVRHMTSRVIATLAKHRETIVMSHLIENIMKSLSDVTSSIRRRGAMECIYITIEKMGLQMVPFIVLFIIPLLGRMSDHEESVRLLSTQCFATLIKLFPLDTNQDSSSGFALPSPMKNFYKLENESSDSVNCSSAVPVVSDTGGNSSSTVPVVSDAPSFLQSTSERNGKISTSRPSPLTEKLLQQKQRERKFLDRLLDPKKIEDFKVPGSVKAQLRSYQQRGVNWLSFLNQYNLHGILCDDMGLGKTIQSLCILAADHRKKEKDIYKGRNVPEVYPCNTGVQSLVVCPPTLTGHWYYEFKRFVDKSCLNPMHYTGPPHERKRLQSCFSSHNVIIASYKIIRNEIDFFSKIRWNYIILDEGHVIKNSKTKSSKAIKELVGNHRLILSGTPIQNNVLELWSLFDFLMPGFLGTERQFIAKYSRPILQSRESKSSSKEQEAGVLAMEALHRQVLPFLLRRVKEDVLPDLPPKITQDYYCDLSPLQEQLYEDFAQTKVGRSVDQSINESETKIHGHVFQALQYLRRVCNHPKLVLTRNHPRYESMMQQIRRSKTPLSDISHSAKLPALKQLLLDCGIGAIGDSVTNNIVSPHRALIFCQLKGMLDIIENDLFKAHMPAVTYLRMDGSVPAGSRQGLVQRFNSDPSIDVFLLTTQVGGLGLNLTGADTVIFVEHDWNPMRDVQAMDRAHRIGQKKVVNIYRLITKGTLEEKIMSFQKFKLMTANSIISQENSSLQTMGTHQLLDLFSFDIKKNEKQEASTSMDVSSIDGVAISGAKKVLENLPDLWDASDYEDEYNLDKFVSNLS